jgi:hypothetical protein
MNISPEKERALINAEIAYTAYSQYSKHKSPMTGKKLPSWKNLPKKAVSAWFASALAVIEHGV